MTYGSKASFSELVHNEGIKLCFKYSKTCVKWPRLSFVCVNTAVQASLLATGNVLKFQNTFLFLFSTKMLVIRAGLHKMLVRIANTDDFVQTASSEAI